MVVALVGHHRTAGTDIGVVVVDVAGHAVTARFAAVHPAIRVDHPRRVLCFHGVGDPGRVELAPALVEHHPPDDRGHAAQLVHHRRQLVLEILFRRGNRIRGGAHGNIERHVQRRHVLPHHQPELVRPVIPPRRFHLGVLAHEIHPHRLGPLEVELQRLVGGRGVDAVRPEALVQRAVKEGDLAVQRDPRPALPIIDNADGAQPGIAGNLVDDLPDWVQQPDLEVVEIRVIRTSTGAGSARGHAASHPLCRSSAPPPHHLAWRRPPRRAACSSRKLLA